MKKSDLTYPINFDVTLKRNPYSGVYIALEGVDGSGKTTQVQKLQEYFKSQGKEVVVTREPRKEGLIGDLVQKILTGKEKVPTIAIQYLFSADRSAHHEELVLPALKKGMVVITDRCFWSAIVYGILDRTGGAYDKNDADLLLINQSILSMYHQFTVPDYTFYLKISLDTALSRINKKSDVREIYEDKKKLEKIIEGYQYLKNKFTDEIIEMNGEEHVDAVTKNILERIEVR